MFPQVRKWRSPKTTAEEQAESTKDVPASQEVEITEDNYRQFMELKDERGQRNILPENAFKPGSGLQKLDKLPEESQKHLRNQLREIIVQGNQWQPGDEDTDYPYVPSDAALANQPLQKQEAEAWGELVDSYHKREGQIYENSTRSQAAMASEDSSDSESGGGSGKESGSAGQSASQGTGQGKDGEVAQESRQRRSESDSAAGGYSPDGSSEQSSAGVSQNAMEFLKGLGKQGSNNAGGNTESTSNGNGQSQGQGEEQALAGQQGRVAQGTSQNAMEFLQGSSKQDSQSGEGSSDASAGDSGQGGEQEQGDAEAGQQSGEEEKHTASTDPESPSQSPDEEPEPGSVTGTSQNALEYLMGEGTEGRENAPPDPATPTGTLSIQDLLNAQGTLNGTETTGTLTPGANEGRGSDEVLPDKDGGNG